MEPKTLLEKLVFEYQELNGTQFDVLPCRPTPLEFAKIVQISRPALIQDYPCALERHLFTDEGLKQLMGEQKVSIALTPDGNADAITTLSHDGKEYFVEPHVEKMALGEFFDRLDCRGLSSPTLPTDTSSSSSSSSFQREREVVYLQSQNGNIHSGSGSGSGTSESEFERLHEYVPRDIDWACQAFGSSADAVNIWIGDERSVTSVHSDPYENIYTVLSGSKHFILFPPTEGWCLKEKTYPRAQYTRKGPPTNPGPLKLTPLPVETMCPETDSETDKTIRWSSSHLSFSDPSSDPPQSAPIRITVNAGETLYLPVGWWHHVSQSTDSESGGGVSNLKGRCVALNWWYDTEMRGMNWVWLSFLRDLGFKLDARC